MASIRLATWNINSIRVRTELLKDVIKRNNLDIILLQETKCQDNDFPISVINSIKWNVIFKGQKSYNGVAILSKYPIEIIENSLPLYNIEQEDVEARYIEALINVEGKIIRVASIYVPNGASVLQPNEELEDSKRFQYKLNFYKRMEQRIKDLKNETNNFRDEYVIFAGDLNVAQEEIDLHNPKANDGNVCFHPLERKSLKEIRKIGLEDIFRIKYPDKKQYTWWDYKTKGFERNVGWRLDYLLCSQNVIKNCTNCYVDEKTRGKQKTSDHAPSIIEFEI